MAKTNVRKIHITFKSQGSGERSKPNSPFVFLTLGKGNEEVQSKKADGLKDETDSSVTGGDAVKTSGDAAEGLEKV